MFTAPSTLPCCAFPTQILAIDDELAMIDSLRFMLQTPISEETDPHQAIAKLKNYHPAITEHIWLNLDDTSTIWDGRYKQPSILDAQKIPLTASLSAHFNDISVLIVDYKMPTIDGISVLRALADKPFKKILLTGEGSEAIAIAAFNEHLIDGFLHKDDPDLGIKLQEAVHRLKLRYFADLSKKTRDILGQASATFTHPAAARFFNDTLEKFAVEEFYLLDINGTYLLKTANNEKKYLLIHTAEFINSIAEYAESENAPVEIVQEIKLKKAFPYFGEELAYWEVDFLEWANYLHPLVEIEGSEKTLYAAVF